jgi:DNA-binding NtrC family response regulator
MLSIPLAGLPILVLEDDPLLRRQICATLEKLDAEVTSASDLRSARRLIRERDFDFALLDLHLPDGQSLDLLKEKSFPANTGVVIMTANSHVAGAVEAMKLGALDYLAKPFDPAELPLVLSRAGRTRQSARRDEHQREENGAAEFFFGTALADLRIHLNKILAADQRVQGIPAPVLIVGETGTGKTTIARWIHQQGPRAAQPLVEVNCSALPEALAESELFGHERGAFTDARAARMGLFEAASGGTLFLDELPSLAPSLQAKILTTLEDHKIRRIGGTKPVHVDVRLIAATSQDLRQLVVEKRFREDLMHRLDLFRLRLPPLRERGEDIVRLAEAMLVRLCRRHRLAPRSLSAAGRQRLLHYPWPGNVRELAHELERAVVFEEAEVLEFHQLQGGAPAPAAAGGAAEPSTDDWFNECFVFPQRGFDMERAILRIIEHALRQTAGNTSAAARLLGVPRDYLRYRLDKQTQAGEKQDRLP